MSNINLEVISEDIDPNRTPQPQHPVSANPTKKRSGFQITSVKDSDHGRPASIVHDGEESADDLDESHASDALYSDVSYSRTNDADNDPESTASEDTLSANIHETPNLDFNHINSIHNAHHHQTLKSGLLQESASKQKKDTDTNHDSGKLQQNAIIVLKPQLKKQGSEQLEPLQELPLDNVSVDKGKDSKSNGADKKVSPPQSLGAGNKVTAPSILSDQSKHANKATVSSNISTSTASQQSRVIYSPDSADAHTVAEKTHVSSALPTSSAQSNKPTSVPASTASSKVPGTRVYKVVKRETAQPTKKMRGRWNFHEFSDTQSPLIGVANMAASVERRTSNHSLPNLTYTNSIISGVAPYQSTSYFQDQLLSASMSTSARHEKSVMGFRADDVLQSAISRYAAGTSGDAATGDTSVANQTQKIDNKIEAAMDLVKKHLMSAVRDEVDELKEKIKELTATITNLTDETTRLKAENKELRSKLPPEVAVQVQAKVNQSPPKDISSTTSQEGGEHKVSGSSSVNTESSTTTSSAIDPLTQKGQNSSIGKDESSTHVSSTRSTDHKVKSTNSNAITSQAIQSTQRQVVHDAQKITISKTTSVTSQPSHNTPVHMQKPVTQTSQQAAEPLMQEHGHVTSQDNHKPSHRNVDHNFERNNPS